VNGVIRGKKVRLDSCIREEVEDLNREGKVTVASCCGHGVYPPTILVREKDGVIRLFYRTILIPRTRNFYRKDDRGFYYIPELSAPVRSGSMVAPVPPLP
jgi:hypothetical protein